MNLKKKGKWNNDWAAGDATINLKFSNIYKYVSYFHRTPQFYLEINFILQDEMTITRKNTWFPISIETE